LTFRSFSPFHYFEDNLEDFSFEVAFERERFLFLLVDNELFLLENTYALSISFSVNVSGVEREGSCSEVPSLQAGFMVSAHQVKKKLFKKKTQIKNVPFYTKWQEISRS
jgi:hypothetical protein